MAQTMPHDELFLVQYRHCNSLHVVFIIPFHLAINKTPVVVIARPAFMSAGDVEQTDAAGPE